MSDDLQARLSEAAHEIERTAAPLDALSVQRIRSVARRHRVQRRTTQSFAGVAAVAVLALVVTLGAELRDDPAPVPPAVTRTPTPTPATPTPAPTPTATPTATPTPTPTLAGPPVRAADLRDSDVVAHLQHPRTGEVWAPATAAPEFATQIGSYDTAYRMGTRGDAEIFMTVSGPGYAWGDTVTGLYERDASGVRLIACPSARSGDPCVLAANSLPTIPRDESTFYDSLTLPAKVSLAPGFELTTAATRELNGTYGQPYGSLPNRDATASDEQVDPLRDLGALDLVAVTWGSEVSGLKNLWYAFTTPLGTQVRLEANDVPAGDFASIRWDDGVDPGSVDKQGQPVVTYSPGAGLCLPARYAVDGAHDPTQWRRAGTSADGLSVYLPVDGGNPTSRAVRAWQESNSWTYSEEVGGMVTGADAGYAFPTDESFLAARALYAVSGPDGQWFLVMRSDAQQIVYECA
ncbi:hypothetical protein [Cellulomonas sp. URHD0024]|uniref:hypothetical protein n=1 Tax=Cellulomonas sp. URHD0024 TaxID=1302620 RepID=UPI0003FB962B|nr:hypothetical protein [Cellulomonas sp. URHD0024]